MNTQIKFNKKVAVTVILAILLFVFGWYVVNVKNMAQRVDGQDESTVINTQPEVKSYTLAEVATHNSETDC
jgi:hypothetical protein